MTNTAQRIQLILAGWDGVTPITGTINTGPISQNVAIIAAEIDGLRDEMAVILRERNDAHLALADRDAIVAAGREQRRLDTMTIAAQADVIDERNAQLAEAVAKHRFCDLQLNTVNTDLRECQSALRLALAGTEQHYFAIPARIDDVRAALADAQAQLAEARKKLKECDDSTDFVQELREAEQSTLANTQRLLGVAQTQIDAKDKRIAELEQLATLSPIKVGDISITLGLTETGEARMTFDGADDATLAVVAGKFALAMQATMDGAK